MNKEENLPSTVIQTNLNITQNDIATLAIAKGEERIRQNITKQKALIKETEEKIQHCKKEFEKIGNSIIATSTQDIVKNIKKACNILKQIEKISIEINNIIEWDTGYRYNFLAKNSKETISPNIIEINISSRQGGRIKFYRNEFEINAKQKELVSIVENQLSPFLVSCKQELAIFHKKLSDMPAFERQMRAAVIKAQLDKTKSGKEILDSIEHELEKSIKLIG